MKTENLTRKQRMLRLFAVSGSFTIGAILTSLSSWWDFNHVAPRVAVGVSG